MQSDHIFATYQPMLLRLAYRILGSYSDAEDVVQDVFAELSRLDLPSIRNIKAYLTKMVTNRCINLLKSARKTRETYIGPWLPEPAYGLVQDGPESETVKQESLSYAFLVLLQTLTPEERVVFVLREVIGYGYAEISDIVQKKEPACRKLFSRAKQKIARDVPDSYEPTETAESFAKQFLVACETGDFGRFIGLLAHDAGLLTDGGGKVRAAVNKIVGRERIQAMFEGVVDKGFFAGTARLVRLAGEPCIQLARDGKTVWVAFLELTPDRSAVLNMFFILNPDKLSHLKS